MQTKLTSLDNENFSKYCKKLNYDLLISARKHLYNILVTKLYHLNNDKILLINKYEDGVKIIDDLINEDKLRQHKNVAVVKNGK